MAGSARTTLLLSKIVAAYGGPSLRGIFEAKTAEMVLGRIRLSRRARASPPNQETIVTFGEWDVCYVRTEFW
jgi:hypothetical protein